MKRHYLGLVLVLLLTWSIGVGAESLVARILLPDGNGAPFATVIIGDQVFTANENGNVEIEHDSQPTALVKWLDLEEELTLGAKMKFTNRLYYGAPYDKFDFLTWGPDIWEVTETAMYAPGGLGNEAQLFLDDSFDNYVIRSRFTAEASGQWFYLRFQMRAIEPGFNGYTFSAALNPLDTSYFERVHGNWDKWDLVTEEHSVYGPMAPLVKNEFVAFLKDSHIVVYIRNAGETEYTRIVDVIDDSEKAFEYGGIGILNSFTDCEVTEFSVFRY